jgi:catechol 2,3-dioxygenase-like lactoylglutathione lyase family enzyme
LPRGLDHIVHAVHDLDAAAEAYARLGFTVGARNKHPWGTHNRIVQFDGTFIELLSIGEPDKIEPHAPRSFSFGAFHRDFLARDQGLDMILLNGSDANADAAGFRSRGIGDFEIFNFERQGQRPDGSIVKLAFSLVFAADLNAPQVGFGTCRHYFPESFWNPEFQKHANGVKRIAGLVLVADQPSRHRDFLKAYTGAHQVRDTGGGFGIQLANGTIDMMTPAEFTSGFAVPPPDTSRGARFAALRFDGAEERPGSQAISGAILLFEADR